MRQPFGLRMLTWFCVKMKADSCSQPAQNGMGLSARKSSSGFKVKAGVSFCSPLKPGYPFTDVYSWEQKGLSHCQNSRAKGFVGNSGYFRESLEMSQVVPPCLFGEGLVVIISLF